MRVNLQPAYLLHRRPFRDSSQLVELFTAEHGRLSLVARGVHRKARGGSTGAMLQPFVPLLVSFSGRGELKTLTHTEVAGRPQRLSGATLFSGFYLNELLVRLLHRYDPHPPLFASYGDTLSALAQGQTAEAVLRRFELELLQELGYSFALDAEADTGELLDGEGWYRLEPERGLVACAGGVTEVQRYYGSDLLAMAAGDFSGSAARTAKRLLRQALAAQLGDAPLRSRALFRQFSAGATGESPDQAAGMEEST